MIQRSKPINQQVIFITGATSSIGIATIRLAVKNGARVYMVGDNEDKLQTIQDEMRCHNLPTAFAVAQCSEFDQLQIAVEHCIDTFGIIDTWINIAVLPFDPSIPDFSEDECKRFFYVNFWSVVNLCKLAMGGSIVLVGTALIEKKYQTQGIYLATMAAIKKYINYFKTNSSVRVTFIVPHRSHLSDLVASRIINRAGPLRLSWHNIFQRRFKVLSPPLFHHQ